MDNEFIHAKVLQPNPNFPLDEYRSILFKNFKEILNIKKINFFKLSQNVRNQEFLDYHSFSNLFDFGDKSLFEISEVMKELDLVISSDTSIIHLAGILNVFRVAKSMQNN